MTMVAANPPPTHPSVRWMLTLRVRTRATCVMNSAIQAEKIAA
jgi:hypothetical protein